MPKSFQDIEQRIIELLAQQPIKQSQIGDHFSMDRYLDVGHTVRDMAVRGVIVREKSGSTYWLRLKTE